MASGDFKSLTRKHGLKIIATFPCSVEDISLAVGEKVGHSGVKSAARMNGAVVIFLDRVEKVNRVIETGITVNGSFVQVLPLAQPATKVVLSNVPPFITDEFLSRELSRHGKVVSPIRKILSGCKSQLLKHVVSHRRQLYMILNNRNEELNLRFLVKVDDYDYVIFATSSVMKCFGCGEEGHTVRSCPGRSDPAPPGPGGAAGAAAGAPAAPLAPERRGATAWRSTPAAGGSPPGVPPAAGSVASSERPVAAPRGRRPTAVSDPVHGVSTVNTPGVSVNDAGECGVNVLDEARDKEMNESGVCEKITKDEVSKQVEGKTGEEEIQEGEEKESEQVKGKTGEEEMQAGEEKESEQVEKAGGSNENERNEMVKKGVLWGERVEEETETFIKPKAATKRKKKNKNTSDAKTSKVVEEKENKLNTDDSESDECVSDNSDIPNFNNSQEKKMYTTEKIKSFLQQTKNQHGVKIENYFPDLSLFYSSARVHMSQKEESGLTDQEVFRLRKLVLKAKKQMNDDGKGSYVCFN